MHDAIQVEQNNASCCKKDTHVYYCCFVDVKNFQMVIEFRQLKSEKLSSYEFLGPMHELSYGCSNSQVLFSHTHF